MPCRVYKATSRGGCMSKRFTHVDMEVEANFGEAGKAVARAVGGYEKWLESYVVYMYFTPDTEYDVVTKTIQWGRSQGFTVLCHRLNESDFTLVSTVDKQSMPVDAVMKYASTKQFMFVREWQP